MSGSPLGDDGQPEADIRRTFLVSSRTALDLVASREVGARWDEPSALRELSLRGLAGHLFRATGSVEAYLDRGNPQGSPIDAASYYAQAVGEPDIHSDLHRAVRRRGEEAAAGRQEELVTGWGVMIERLEERLESEPRERLVRVFKDLVLRLDDYLVTRVIELVVHCDDLAISVDLDPPAPPREALRTTISCLVDVARLKHGDLAVVRALARRERDAVEALRVL